MTVTIENLYTGNGSTTDYSFTFPYLDDTDIKASLDGVVTTNFRLLNATTVQFVNNTTANTPTAPGNSVAIRIYRDTGFTTPKATFYPGSAIRANDLNDNTLQNLYVNQESNEKVTKAWLTGDPTIVSTETWHTSDDTKVATTKAIEGRIDTKIDSALVDDIAAGSSISITDNSPSSGKVTINVIAATGSNSGSLSASDKSKLDGIETSATADQTNAEIRAAVEAASDSNVFTDADHSKLNAIEASATADQTAAEIRTLVESASDSNVFTDADHTKLNAIEASATADQTASEIKTLLQSDKLTTSEITAGTLDNRYYTETELDAGQLDNRYYTETESDARYFNISTGDTIKDGDTFPDNDTTIATTAAINDRIIDLVDDVGGFVPIANETSFPNANPDVNNGAGTLVSIKALSSNLTSNGSGVATIANGTVGNSTVTINGLANSTTYAATFGMIVETTSTLNTYTFHRLVPKATEVSTVSGSISNINTVAGDISNVNTVAGNNTNINTVASANSNITTVAGNNANITTVAGNNTNINTVAGANSNISTVAGAITNVNNVGGSIANVNTVATNLSSVNDFAARYRVASSAPSSSLDTGDLYFDTTGNELKVYNGSAWQGGVTATGNLLSKSGDQMTGNLTFSGSQTVDGRDVSVDGTKLDGIAANANNYTHPNHSGEVTSSADGATVVADNIIDEANLKVSNSPTNGYFLSAQSGNTGGLTWAEVSQVLTEDSADNLIAGDNAGTRIGSGQDNVILGDYAGRSITDASYTVVLGKQAMGTDSIDTTGNHNVAIGYRTLYACTSGNENIAIGDGAGKAITTGENNIAIGEDPLIRCTTGKENITIGNRAGEYISEGDANIIMGDYSASQLTTGDNNVCIGNDTGGTNLTTGSRNTCIGFGAEVSSSGVSDEITLGYSNTSRFRIPALGVDFNQVSNKRNYGIGQDVFASLTTGVQNVAMGPFCLDALTEGNSNTGIGQNCLTGVTTGSYNVGVGYWAGMTVSTGDYNSCYGYVSGQDITTGSNNTCIGTEAGNTGTNDLTTGSNNTCIGHASQASSATVSNEVTIGDTNVTKFRVPGVNFVIKDTTATEDYILTLDANGEAGWEAAAGGSIGSVNQNTIGGYNAGVNFSGAYDTTLFGYQAGTAITSGDYHTIVGSYAGASLTTSGSGTFFGYAAGRYVTGHSNIGMGTNAVAGTSSAAVTGTRNIGLGNDSGRYITSGARNVGIGASTNGAVTTGSNNSSLGDYALSGTTTGSNNIGIGHNAAKSISTGSYNIGIGSETFYSNAVTGDSNVGIGYKVLKAVTSGTHNFAVGQETAMQITTGSYNTAMGGAAMFPVTTGSYNTGFGYNTCGEVTTGSNNTCLGFDAGRSASPSGQITTGDNVICLGNNSVSDIYCADTSIAASDKRDKTDVANFTHGLKWINQLKPVTYRWDKRTWYNEYNEDGSLKTAGTPDGSKKRARQHIGFLAQDVLAIEQADGYASKKDDMLVVNFNEDNTAYGLKYERLVPVLVNAIKELSAKVTALEAA